MGDQKAEDADVRFTLLHVENDEEILSLVQGIVARVRGCSVISVSSVADAMASLNEKQIDIIFTDMHMHDGNGIDLIRSTRSIDRHRDTPIFLISGDLSLEDDNESADELKFELIIKPFSIHTVIAHLNDARDRKSS